MGQALGVSLTCRKCAEHSKTLMCQFQSPLSRMLEGGLGGKSRCWVWIGFHSCSAALSEVGSKATKMGIVLLLLKVKGTGIVGNCGKILIII